MTTRNIPLKDEEVTYPESYSKDELRGAIQTLPIAEHLSRPASRQGTPQQPSMPLLRSQNPKGTPVFVPSQSLQCKAQHSTSVYPIRTQLRAEPPELMPWPPSWGFSPTKPICLWYGPGVKYAIAASLGTLRQKPTQILPLQIIAWRKVPIQKRPDLMPWNCFKQFHRKPMFSLHITGLRCHWTSTELPLVATQSFRSWHIHSQGSLYHLPKQETSPAPYKAALQRFSSLTSCPCIFAYFPVILG